MNRKTSGKHKKSIGLVPTFDIDLCWHTHQLHSVSYRQWCIEHLGVAVNHDDTVGQESLDNGLRETTSAWYDAYRESYVPNEPGDARSHSIAGVRLPSLGMFSRKMREKSSESTKGTVVASERLMVDPACRQDNDATALYMSMYPYWLFYPHGWNFPAAYANSRKAGGYRGCAPSVDQQRGRSFILTI